MFCNIVGLRAVDVRKARSMDELLMTQIPGGEKSAIDEILASRVPKRVDEVRVHKPHKPNDSQMTFIISSYPFFDVNGYLLGSCLLMRDVTAESNLQDKYKEKTIESITDPLTGLFTRRHFETWLDKELERCRELSMEPNVSLLVFDLDKFKTINDTYGHLAGDYVLAETSRILKTNCRQSDILGRYGGEELIVILGGTSPRGACLAAEKFRLAIQNHTYCYEGKNITVTSSIGVSAFKNNLETREIVFARADACLYAAKQAGRNRVFANFGEELMGVQDYLQNAS